MDAVSPTSSWDFVIKGPGDPPRRPSPLRAPPEPSPAACFGNSGAAPVPTPTAPVTACRCHPPSALGHAAPLPARRDTFRNGACSITIVCLTYSSGITRGGPRCFEEYLRGVAAKRRPKTHLWKRLAGPQHPRVQAGQAGQAAPLLGMQVATLPKTAVRVPRRRACRMGRRRRRSRRPRSPSRPEEGGVCAGVGRRRKKAEQAKWLQEDRPGFPSVSRGGP